MRFQCRSAYFMHIRFPAKESLGAQLFGFCLKLQEPLAPNDVNFDLDAALTRRQAVGVLLQQTADDFGQPSQLGIQIFLFFFFFCNICMHYLFIYSSGNSKFCFLSQTVNAVLGFISSMLQTAASDLSTDCPTCCPDADNSSRKQNKRGC